MTGPPEMPCVSRDGSLEITGFDEFAAQYRQVFPQLRLIAVAITNDAAHAEDIVQEAALIAVSKIGQFRPGSSFAAWMAEIVRRCALNYRRKVHSRKTYAVDPASFVQREDRSSESIRLWDDINNSGKLLPLQASFDDEVVAALSLLSEEARCCLLLRVVRQLSYAEISELMQIPEGTAMSHVHRGKLTLRERLALPHHTSEKVPSPPT